VRATLNIDDDVLVAVRERAVREKRTVGAVLSELVRAALAAAAVASRDADSGRHGFRPLPRRGPALSNSLIDELREAEGA
jgi:hypothetical protein